MLVLHRAQGGQGAINISTLDSFASKWLLPRLRGFRRGVTRYPIPGAMVYPATTTDLKQVYASDGRANVEIGTVFPTRDIRAGLYVDAMLGKHFALLGSTGTGKSTSAALILHRICEAAPQGHVLMIDPHGGKNDLGAVTNFTPEYPTKMDQGLKRGPSDPWPIDENVVLIANNDQLVYTNAGSDPYSNNNGVTMLSQNQSNID